MLKSDRHRYFPKAQKRSPSLHIRILLLLPAPRPAHSRNDTDVIYKQRIRITPTRPDTHPSPSDCHRYPIPLILAQAITIATSHIPFYSPERSPSLSVYTTNARALPRVHGRGARGARRGRGTRPALRPRTAAHPSGRQLDLVAFVIAASTSAPADAKDCASARKAAAALPHTSAAVVDMTPPA